MIDSEKIKQAVQRLQRQMPEAIAGDGGGAGSMSPAIGSALPVPTPIPIPPAPSAVNQIRNGELGHSFDTWFNPPPGSPATDVGKEAAFWFSNTAPVPGVVLDLTTDARTSSVNDTLKDPSHSTYDPTRCDWDSSNGVARLQGTASLDAPFPNNRIVSNNRKVEYLGALIAKRNATIVVPEGYHIYCGLYDNTNAAPLPDWIMGTPFAVSAVVRGGVPATTTERRYKIFAFTDRGYTYLSAEFALVGAPSDAEFATGDFDVFVTWKAIPGILEYRVFRFDVVAGKYRFLKGIGSGNPNYGDNNRMEDNDVGGYPTATFTSPTSYAATGLGDLTNLAVDGNSWDALALAPPIPDNYDMSKTTAEQVLRIGQTKPLDRAMIDAVALVGDATVTSVTAEFTALDVGRVVELMDADENVLTTTIASVTADDEIELTDVWPFPNATGVTLYIVEGGDHGLLIDAIHVSYVAGAAFAAHPDDNRLAVGGQNPFAAPNHSSQGGSGGGGGDVEPGGGGIVGCIEVSCPVNVYVGHTLEAWPWKAIRAGEYLFSGDLIASRVLKKPPATRTINLYLLRVRATWRYDIEVPCSPQQPAITDRLDGRGRAVEYLTPGARVLISVDGVVRRMRVREIIATGRSADVGIFTLSPSHVFSAGYPRYRTWWQRAIAWVLRDLKRRKPIVGVLLHNVKPERGSV